MVAHPALLRSPRRRAARLRSVAITLVAVVAVLGLAACGSRLDPETVSAVNGSVPGQGGAPAPDGTGTGAGTPGGAGSGDVGTTGSGGAGSAGTAGTAGTAGAGSGGSGGGSGGTSAAGGGAGDGAGGGGASSATGGTRAGSCKGFQNGPGITDETITIANVSDISGPVPGLFQAAQDAVRAYVAYFNATSDICGRKLALKTYDSRTDAGADQQGYAAACESAFAVVGSMSAFDSGGAVTAEECGLPDLRSAIVTTARWNCATCFGANSVSPNAFHNALPDFVLKNYGDAGKHAALLYLNAGAAAENAEFQRDALTKRGMTFEYFQSIDVAEFNYAPYVQELKSRDIGYVQFLGAYAQAVRLAKAMEQQNYEPTVYMVDPAAYVGEFVKTGGSAVEGTVLFMNFVPFAEASSNKEMSTYLRWLQQVKPGADPSFSGVFAWSAARLFVERAIALGGELDRKSMVTSLRKVDDWTANGMHAPQHVGPKRTSECQRFLRLESGTWVPEGSRKYTCHGVTKVG